jgi:hypothetical protein
MHVFTYIASLSQAILRVVLPAADTCQFHTLWPQLPDPLFSLEGTCIVDTDCTGFLTKGFCHGAANIMVSQGNAASIAVKGLSLLWQLPTQAMDANNNA